MPRCAVTAAPRIVAVEAPGVAAPRRHQFKPASHDARNNSRSSQRGDVTPSRTSDHRTSRNRTSPNAGSQISRSSLFFTTMLFAVVAVAVSTLGCIGQNSTAVAEPEDDPAANAEIPPGNRLARETSPYLLLHAQNPVDWYPWGPEALEKARAEDKVIFLSIGYSSCHWCHVMERLVFSNASIARFMNEHFVNIKVDREERPDIDDIYMTALTLYLEALGSRQGGGWPLSMFLTPDGRPIAGATYLPPKDEPDRPGFATLCRKVHTAWSTRRGDVEKNADFLSRAVATAMRPRMALKPVELQRAAAAPVIQHLAEAFDPDYGGFGYQAQNPAIPKFPVPSKLQLLEYAARQHGDDQAAGMLYKTLDRMAAGGIRDHLLGGFHRYSVDRYWRVPHFEKMLYDNAQLLEVYAAAYARTREPMYIEVATGIADFMLTELKSQAGGFTSSLDADTEEVEGKYYVFTDDELTRLLTPAELQACAKVYGCDGPVDFEAGRVLYIACDIDTAATQLQLSEAQLQRRLQDVRRKLLAARSRRAPPRCDTKVLAAWNGMAIRGLALAGRDCDQPEWTRAAGEAATFVMQKFRDDRGRLRRSYTSGRAQIRGYLEDYALVSSGLIALFETTRSKKWLKAATELTDLQIAEFWDQDRGGFYFTANDHEKLLTRIKPAFDSVVPSGNSVSVRNLVKLAAYTKNDDYLEKAAATLTLFVPQMNETPGGLSQMALALGEYLDETAEPASSKTPNADDGNRSTEFSPSETQGDPASGEDQADLGDPKSVDDIPPTADNDRSHAIVSSDHEDRHEPEIEQTAGETQSPANSRKNNGTAPSSGNGTARSSTVGSKSSGNRNGAQQDSGAAANRDRSENEAYDDAGSQDAAASKSGKRPKSNPVKAAAYLRYKTLPAGQPCPVAIVIEIDEGWHINPNTVDSEYAIATEIEFEAARGSTLDKLQFPAGKKVADPQPDMPSRHYSGRVIVFGTVTAPLDADGREETLTFNVSFQPCNDTSCLPPKTITVETNVAVRRATKSTPPEKQYDKLFALAPGSGTAAANKSPADGKKAPERKNSAGKSL